jgi:hypothetical protein
MIVFLMLYYFYNQSSLSFKCTEKETPPGLIPLCVFSSVEILFQYLNLQNEQLNGNKLCILNTEMSHILFSCSTRVLFDNHHGYIYFGFKLCAVVAF